MDLRNLTLFDMTKTKMDWLAQRQKILAQNIANANTPNYKARDLRELDFNREIERVMNPSVEAVRTNPAHQSARCPSAARSGTRHRIRSRKASTATGSCWKSRWRRLEATRASTRWP